MYNFYLQSQIHIKIPLTGYVGLIDVTMTGATMHAVVAEYPHSTLKGTPTWNGHSIKCSAAYKTYVAGVRRNLDVYIVF